MMARLFAASLVLLAVACGSPGEQAVAPPPAPDRHALLDGLVTGPERVAPGATAYVSGPHGTWLGAAGVADLETGERMTPDARMRLRA